MTFLELKALYESYTGTSDDVEDSVLALWMNEAQLDLAMKLGKGASYTYENASANTGHELPKDCIDVLECSVGYEINSAGQIVFFSSGDIDIVYRKIPTLFIGSLDGVDEESELHQATHHLLAMWAASRYWDQESEGDSEESTHATKWMNYYQIGKAQAINALPINANIDRWTIA